MATNVQRASAATVCIGDTVALRANASDPDGDTLLYSWQTTGGRIVGDGPNVTFDSAGLSAGDYTVTVQVDDGCGCVAFDSKVIHVENCPPNINCFNTSLDVTPASQTVQPGEAVNFSTPGVTGGQNYGNVSYTWTASAGAITGSGTSARLDTTGARARRLIPASRPAANSAVARRVARSRTGGTASVTPPASLSGHHHVRAEQRTRRCSKAYQDANRTPIRRRRSG